MNKRAVGTRYEQLAAQYLTERGLTILESNYRIRSGEIDLIALDRSAPDVPGSGTVYVFVEVKYRKTASSGQPFEAVTYQKRKTICRVADHYRLSRGGLHGCMFRFDVISILGEEITWYQNAFPYTV